MIYLTVLFGLFILANCAVTVAVVKLMLDRQAQADANAQTREKELLNRLLVLSDPNRYLTFQSMEDQSPPDPPVYIDEDKGYSLETDAQT